MPLNFGQSLHHMIFLPPQIFDKGLYLFIYLFIHLLRFSNFWNGHCSRTTLLQARNSPIHSSMSPTLFEKHCGLFTSPRIERSWLLSITFLLKESAETWSLVEDKAELYQKVWSRSRNSPFLCFQTLKFMIQNRTICCNFSQSSPVSIVFF